MDFVQVTSFVNKFQELTSMGIGATLNLTSRNGYTHISLNSHVKHGLLQSSQSRRRYAGKHVSPSKIKRKQRRALERKAKEEEERELARQRLIVVTQDPISLTEEVEKVGDVDSAEQAKVVNAGDSEGGQSAVNLLEKTTEKFEDQVEGLLEISHQEQHSVDDEYREGVHQDLEYIQDVLYQDQRYGQTEQNDIGDDGEADKAPEIEKDELKCDKCGQWFFAKAGLVIHTTRVSPMGPCIRDWIDLKAKLYWQYGELADSTCSMIYDDHTRWEGRIIKRIISDILQHSNDDATRHNLLASLGRAKTRAKIRNGFKITPEEHNTLRRWEHRCIPETFKEGTRTRDKYVRHSDDMNNAYIEPNLTATSWLKRVI